MLNSASIMLPRPCHFTAVLHVSPFRPWDHRHMQCWPLPSMTCTYLTDSAVPACLHVVLALVAGIDKAVLALRVQLHKHAHGRPLSTSQWRELQVFVPCKGEECIPPIHQVTGDERVWINNRRQGVGSRAGNEADHKEDLWKRGSLLSPHHTAAKAERTGQHQVGSVDTELSFPVLLFPRWSSEPPKVHVLYYSLHLVEYPSQERWGLENTCIVPFCLVYEITV